MEALDERLQSATQVRVVVAFCVCWCVLCVRVALNDDRLSIPMCPTLDPSHANKTKQYTPHKTQSPVNPPYRLSRLISQITSTEGRAAIVVEISRPSPSSTPAQLAALARRAVSAGADAIVVRVDSEDTPEGSKDLWAVTQAVPKVPVLARDWYIHPLQIVEAKEAGAAGLIGVIAQVNGRGTAVMSSFCAALGLDAPVEVVNARVGGCVRCVVQLCW